jgi:hypothetical protein
MNGDRASRQIQRIQEMVKQSGSKCRVEVGQGELDSVRLAFHCDNGIHRIAWVGQWLETLNPDDLWRQLDLETRGAITKPDAA